MTRVAHRVAALEEQQFLIIHATADGEAQGQTPCKSGGAFPGGGTGFDKQFPLFF